MPIRNPFRRAGAPSEVVDENQRPTAERGFEKTPVAGVKPIEIREPLEYKLSEIKDGGVFVPPSPPTEKPRFWHSKSNTSTTSSNHRSLLSENEPFNISRESFDSYRRSFDISARSPIPDFHRPSLDARHSADTRRSLDVRQSSLDVRRSRATPRSSFQGHRDSTDSSLPTQAEEGFEDVGLNDEPKPAKKKGIFARFGDSTTNSETVPEEKPPASHHHFNFVGRKRAQSGQGSELKSMPKPAAPPPTEVA